MDQALSSGGSNASSQSGGECSRIRCSSITYSNGGGNGGGIGNGCLSQEVKDLYRSLYIITKQLDESKRHMHSMDQLFEHDIEELRAKLVQICKQIIFKDYQSVGKKVREIMWRRGYYEFIAFVKKVLAKNANDPKAKENLQKMERFLCAGIFNYKRLSAKMEEIYDLDLKYLIDFSIISEGYISDLIAESECENKEKSFNDPMQAVDKSMEAVSFALDTIHSSLLSLGDLHRYFLDFRIESKLRITKTQVAKYYLEAFKLNPAIGMAQNQLGTLYYGQNNDLDSIYHYLYSLVCLIPFELSENNVIKLLAKHAEYLSQLDPDNVEFCIKNFLSRFFLIVDIFFFDKEVSEFNSICHSVLVDLRKILCNKLFCMNEKSVFEMVSILFFCLSKLKMINSPKVYALNAFLVAMCSDLIDAFIVNLEETIVAKKSENEEFQLMYEKKFDEFDNLVHKSRNEYKNWLAAVGESEKKEKKPKPVKECSTDSRESQHSVDDIKILESGGKQHSTHDDSTDKHGGEPISTRSSDEAKESDLKTPLSCKSKKRGMRLRRRRRKVAQSDDSSCYDTESELDTDFYTDEEDYTDLSSNFDTDFSDIDVAEPHNEEHELDEGENDDKKIIISGALNRPKGGSRLTAGNSKENLPETTKVSMTYHQLGEDIDNEEENEKIVYPDQQDGKLPNSQEIDSDELLRSFEVLQLNNNSSNGVHSLALQSQHHAKPTHKLTTNESRNLDNQQNLLATSFNPDEPPRKFVYRNKYSKINPNIIIDFAESEPTIRALKILFDWLRINHEILVGCYHSNPEFIHKIMKLVNFCNIDVFTRKVYFEREFLNTTNVRQTLSELFDVRTNVPLSEDFAFKNFDIFQSTQITLDWETIIRERVTTQEESILRVFKFVDFGFFICKQKKFNYRFCIKSRRFVENLKKKREEKKSNSSRRRERRTARNAQRKRTEGRTRRYSDRKNGIVRKSYTSNEEKDTVEEGRKLPRKGYLRNRNAEKAAALIASAAGGAGNGGASAAGGTGGTSASTTTNSVIEKLNLQSSSGADEERSERSKKCELMGRLWLKNEVETLEEQLRNNPSNIVMTPFIVVDAKALTEYNGMVKNLVKSKKCIVLIPNAVFNELDELKKRSENARNVIRWLEQEFQHGNRHLRAQRDNETLQLTLLKISRKIDREASVFLQIAQFCNHLVVNHSDPNSTEFQKYVVTYLSGDNLHEKNRQQQNFSFTGILDSIPVRYYQIASFYAKFKANKK